MSWQNRLRQMLLAGGVLAGGCGSGNLQGGTGGGTGTGGTGVPCGNANPDPCICGRPDANADAAAACQAEVDCRAAGGFYVAFSSADSDGGVIPPHCETDGGSATGADGGSDVAGAD